MLGDLIEESKGKITGQRVLSADGPKIEVSFMSQGKLLDIGVEEVATFVSMPRSGGVMYGEGNGVMMSKDGEVVTWSGNGIGRFGQNGKAVWRGAVYLQTNSPGKLGALNNVMAVFEFEADSIGDTTSKSWQWK